MSIPLEYWNLIITVESIERLYPGGWSRCLADHGLEAEPSSNGASWHDGTLFRTGAMEPLAMELMLARWTDLGFSEVLVSGRRRFVADLCVYATFANRPRYPCTWLDIDVENATATLRADKNFRRPRVDERVAKLKTPEDCERLARNAMAQGRDDLMLQARRRAVELRAEAHGAMTAAERDCLAAVYAYEDILSSKHGKRTRASRTWQAISRLGVLAAIERCVDRPDGTAGFTALKDAGLENYAFEAVVLRHPDCFSSEAVVRATDRMSRFVDESASG